MNIMRPKPHKNGLIWPKQEREIFYIRLFDWIILICSFLRQRCCNTQVAMKRDKGLQKLHLLLEVSVVGWLQPAAKLPHICLIPYQPPAGWRRIQGEQKQANSLLEIKTWLSDRKRGKKLQQKPRTSGAKVAIPHFPEADWCPASHGAVSTLEDKTPHPLLSLPQFYCWAWLYMVWSNLWPGGAICPCCVFFQPLAHPQTTLGGDRVGNKKAWVLWKHSSATSGTAVCYQHFFSCKSKTQQHADCYKES